jgi:hypothetical protein
MFMLPIFARTGFFHLRKIARIKEYLSTSDIQTLVHAFITSKLIDRLQNMQNCVARLVAGSKKYDDHITPLSINETITLAPHQSMHHL